ncbi:CRISPR-associated helicase Cas3' [Methylobacterium sp.]|uniref:CRISPR-associated helicase Cas3' n=1 Tax=Methylobacterium sp. TaxID=409 RepID=UPI0025DB35EB|nr:CRISPR-associated helicase Cas3' [Methylobacterium sp.]MBY0256934.1 CRISPR-associated helicase Cas3' [Methylobacterium sp.]
MSDPIGRLTLLAHSLPGQPEAEWEQLGTHLHRVANLAGGFAAAFGCGGLGRAAGLLHDLGKASDAFQAYIRQPRSDGATGPRGPDHSTAGAQQALVLYPQAAARWLAYVVAGHHAGLADSEELLQRLGSRPPPYGHGLDAAGPLPGTPDLVPTAPLKAGAPPGFAEAFLVRMLFSCLVDADRLATRAFYEGDTDPPFASVAELRDRLRAHLATMAGTAPAVDALRREVLAHAVARAELSPGLFTLTVPTGGGKTFTSLAFALEHAARHGLRRVVHVIPFTSIVEQTADAFRRALGSETDVLEHHSVADWGDDEGEAGDGLAKLRRDAAENWSAPVVVTTAVQFFESLFSNRPSRCRKLHSLARSVIVVDEAQTMPLPLLRPCLAALDELARNYGASVVLCTATQPALRVQDEFKSGLDIGPERELAPEPLRLYGALRRVRVEVLKDGALPDAAVAERIAAARQILCVVNTRAHARALFEEARGAEGLLHLSTLMCPAHRRTVLAEMRRRLAEGAPVRVVSTSLVEAGVDVDFPEVWRAVAGIDSIAQAAGRCNRNGRLPEAGGRVVVFEPEARWKPPAELAQAWEVARSVLAKHDDPLGLAAVATYFGELYYRRGQEELDAAVVEERPGILAAFARNRGRHLFPFRAVASAFRMIDDALLPVVVPLDDVARDALARVRFADRPSRGDWRRLQAYTVGIPRRAWNAWLAAGALLPVRSELSDGPMAFRDDSHYRADTGLDIEALHLRDAGRNII